MLADVALTYLFIYLFI